MELPVKEVHSPASIQLALSMQALGAYGNTLNQILKVIGEISPDALGKLLAPIEGLKVHNKIYVKDSIKLLDEYSEDFKKYFDGAIESCSFSSGDFARINKDIFEKTTIKDAIDPCWVDVLLVNLVYFTRKWEVKFKESIEGTFYGTEKESTVKFMKRTDEILYDINSNTVLLPYKGLDMFFVISSNKIDLDKLKPRRSYMELFIPKFRVESDIDLKAVLISLGVTDMFSISNADFRFLSSSPLYVEKIIHKAFVDVDEEGTVAGAVTAVKMLRCISSRVPIVRYDRPFNFAIVDKNKVVWFTGKVENL